MESHQIELDGNSYVVTTLDWIAGSSLGTMTIVDLDGSVYNVKHTASRATCKRVCIDG